MKRIAGLVGMVMGLATLAGAQSNDPWLGLVPLVEHTEGELAGMATYRLYLYMANADDFLVSCSGDDQNPMEIVSSSSPAWFQHEVATTAFATDVNPVFFSAFPEFAFDSWLTIGAENNEAAVDVISLADPSYDAFAEFEDGQSVYVDGEIGCVWFVLPNESSVEAFAGDDLRTLVGQFTTSGTISGHIQVQVFRNFDNNDEFRETIPILMACNDPNALNYEPLSFNADGCVYPEVDVVNDVDLRMDMAAFPSPASDQVTLAWTDVASGQMADVQIVALDGRVIQILPNTPNHSKVDVSGIPAGQYIVVANASGATMQVPLLIVR